MECQNRLGRFLAKMIRLQASKWRQLQKPIETAGPTRQVNAPQMQIHFGHQKLGVQQEWMVSEMQ